jgi:hypothetical protein
MQEDVQKIKYLQDKFRSNLSALQKAKDGFLKLFRSKLEEKKIEQIKNSFFINNSKTE